VNHAALAKMTLCQQVLNFKSFFRKVAAFCIGVTLYGGGCVFIVLLATFVQNIVQYAGYDGVSKHINIKKFRPSI